MKTIKQNYIESLADTVSGEMEFYGTEAAELFTMELKESLAGVLEKSFVYNEKNPGDNFVTTSVDGRVCSNHLWSRDAGTLMRELVHWGYLGHACYLADILLNLVDKNQEGYFTFPMYFLRGQKASGSELDGTSSVLIGFVLLWKRLEQGHPVKKRIYDFLTGEASPIRYVIYRLGMGPLIAGSGEFGGGMFVEGEYYNVVQNYLIYLTLKSVEGMMRECGNTTFTNTCMENAHKILSNIEKYLIDEDGAWIWCIDPQTMKPEEAVLNSKANKGFGGINGVIAMYADVFGFELPDWKGVNAAKKSFDRLFAARLRREQYEKYGIWTQFDTLDSGLLTSPAYGQGYALQASLMFDRLDMADRLVDFLAEATYQPLDGYHLDRDSKYYFYERILSPDFIGIKEFDQGCGALNLVNVAEPLKVARMIAGLDDTSLEKVKIIPRIPPSWKGFKVSNWPIFAGGRIVSTDILYEKYIGKRTFHLKTNSEGIIPHLEIRIPSENGKFSRHIFENASHLELMLE